MSESALVLVVEDEYFLQAYVEQILNDTGFAAESAFSGEEALTLFNSGFQKFKAVITDIRLGGRMNGWEVALRIREKEAAIPVIYVTAQAAEEWVSQGVPKSVLIPKPFAPAQLITALSTVLNIETPPAR